MTAGEDFRRAVRRFEISRIGRPVVQARHAARRIGSREIMTFAIKVEIRDPRATAHDFVAQKTMYGGKHIAAGDVVFVFASGRGGGLGLVARGVATSVEATPRVLDLARQTPRVSVRIERMTFAKRALGRADLEQYRKSSDGRPETELDFKFYRQATDKLVGISDRTAAYLETFF